MKKALEYRQHAKECRVLAAQAVSEEDRQQLIAMAETWEALATERENISAKDAARFEPPTADPERDPRARKH